MLRSIKQYAKAVKIGDPPLKNKINRRNYLQLSKQINKVIQCFNLDKEEDMNHLNALITAFTSPIPTNIYTDYDNKTKNQHKV